MFCFHIRLQATQHLPLLVIILDSSSSTLFKTLEFRFQDSLLLRSDSYAVGGLMYLLFVDYVLISLQADADEDSKLFIFSSFANFLYFDFNFCFTSQPHDILRCNYKFYCFVLQFNDYKCDTVLTKFRNQFMRPQDLYELFPYSCDYVSKSLSIQIIFQKAAYLSQNSCASSFSIIACMYFLSQVSQVGTGSIFQEFSQFILQLDLITRQRPMHFSQHSMPHNLHQFRFLFSSSQHTKQMLVLFKSLAYFGCAQSTYCHFSLSFYLLSLY